MNDGGSAVRNRDRDSMVYDEGSNTSEPHPGRSGSEGDFLTSRFLLLAPACIDPAPEKPI
jgi:hypothetical protein